MKDQSEQTRGEAWLEQEVDEDLVHRPQPAHPVEEFETATDAESVARLLGDLSREVLGGGADGVKRRLPAVIDRPLIERISRGSRPRLWKPNQ